MKIPRGDIDGVGVCEESQLLTSLEMQRHHPPKASSTQESKQRNGPLLRGQYHARMALQYSTVFEKLRSAAMNFVISVLINGSKGLDSSPREYIPEGASLNLKL